jgi:hypothetical protein
MKPIVKKRDDYGRIRRAGRLGSTKDATWNRKRHMHTCCKSKVGWYHKVTCPAVNGTFDAKITEHIRSKMHIKINELRLKGKNSGEIAKILKLPLSKVNAIFSQIP